MQSHARAGSPMDVVLAGRGDSKERERGSRDGVVEISDWSDSLCLRVGVRPVLALLTRAEKASRN